jgi:hypothetical protein
MKQLHYFLLFSLVSCKSSTFYDVQYLNKTGLKLTEITTSIDADINIFTLDIDEKSSVFRMECTTTPLVGPPLIHHTVKEFMVNDSIFKYKYGNMYDLHDFDKKKVNLLEIVRDSSKFDKEAFFRFKLMD